MLRSLAFAVALAFASGVAFAETDTAEFYTAQGRMTECLHQLPTPAIQSEVKFAILMERYVMSCGRDFEKIIRSWNMSATSEGPHSWAILEAGLALGCQFIDPDTPIGYRSVYCTGFRR